MKEIQDHLLERRDILVEIGEQAVDQRDYATVSRVVQKLDKMGAREDSRRLLNRYTDEWSDEDYEDSIAEDIFDYAQNE